MTETPWRIRAVARRDLPEILSIETAQFPEPWSRAMLLDEITNSENRRYTAAIEDGVLVGYLGVMFVIDEMHVNTLGTRPHHEGRGIASSLLDEVWPVALERGCTKATLEVAVSNVRAQELYRRYGFAPVGIRKNYYNRIGEDALVLWADLDARSSGEHLA